MAVRFEIGSHPWPTEQSRFDPCTYDSHAELLFLKVMQNNMDKISYETMPQISPFLAGYRTGLMYRILENAISGHHNFKTASGSKLVSHQWRFIAFTRPKVYYSLSDTIVLIYGNVTYQKSSREFSLWMRAAWPTKKVTQLIQRVWIIRPSFNHNASLFKWHYFIIF